MEDFKDILEKLKDVLSKELGNIIIKDKDIAQALGLKYDVFRKNKQFNKIPYFQIMHFLAKRNLSINYFFFNQLPESLIENTSKYIILKYKKINASAGTGTFNYHINVEDIIVDKNIVEYLKTNYKCTQIYQTFGDSMYPTISENSLIFVDTSKTALNQKDIFFIETIDGLFIKKIKILKNKFYLSSINQEYKDIEVKELKIIGKVTGVISKI